MVTMTSVSTPLASDLGAGASFTAILSTASTSLYWGTPGGAPIAVASIMGSPTELIDFALREGDGDGDRDCARASGGARVQDQRRPEPDHRRLQVAERGH